MTFHPALRPVGSCAAAVAASAVTFRYMDDLHPLWATVLVFLCGTVLVARYRSARLAWRDWSARRAGPSGGQP